MTTQPLLNSDNDETADLYEYDFNAPAHEKIIRVSAGGVGDPTPGSAALVQGVARVSEDGSHIYFVARGVLTSTPNSAAQVAQMGANNLYVYNTLTKETTFIAVLLPEDTENWTRRDERPVDVTPDGRFIVFTSAADLTPDDTSSMPQVFEYDAQAKVLTRVSRAESGLAVGGRDFSAKIVHPRYAGTFDPATQPSSVSDDGAYVAFQSEAKLTRQAALGFNNVYEFHDGRVSLISDGQDRSSGGGGIPSVSLVGVDGSGTDIFFMTADQLVPQDGDTQEDVYDARIDGGFLPVAPLECSGDGCQGPDAFPPSLEPAGSVIQAPGEQFVEPPVNATTAPKAKLKKATHKRKAKAHTRRSRKARHGVAKTTRKRTHR